MASCATERPAVPTHEAVRAELTQVLGSRTFARSERQRRFLRHAVEAAIDGRLEASKESALGVAVFDRGAEFDPRSDNIVRVEARRLRQRLQDYYRTEGSTSAVVIDLPTGGYLPQFSWRTIQDAAPPVPARSLSRRHVVAAGIVLLVTAAGVIPWANWREPPLVAVLPFAEYSQPDAAAGEAGPYRGDAIADDILQLLAETPRLHVVSRTSSFRFRGEGADLAAIRERLGARMLLEGSVRYEGAGVRIAVRLVDGETGVPLWADTQETDAAGLERAERSIAAGVAAVLKGGSPRRASAHNPPAEARDLLARARYLAGKGGPENRLRAVEHYERAVALDPNYARGWAELARLLSLMAFQNSDEAGRLEPRIKDAASRALRLDPSLADPHFALARLAWAHQWDWSTAERGWKKTLAINPNYAAAHQAYALALVTRRRFQEAVAHSRRAVEIDPMAFAASNDLGVVLYASRQFDAAASHARASISLAPESAIPHFLLGVVEAGRNRYGEAIPELEKAARALDRAPEVLGRLGNVYARAGRYNEARAVLAEMERNPAAGRIYLAMVETGLGNRDRALGLLASSVERREADIVFLGAEPVFDPLRPDPRFAAACRKLGVPTG